MVKKKKTISIPTLDLYGVNRTDMNSCLAISDAIIKSKTFFWDLICDQYANVFENMVKPMDHAIIYHIYLIEESFYPP